MPGSVERRRRAGLLAVGHVNSSAAKLHQRAARVYCRCSKNAAPTRFEVWRRQKKSRPS